MSPLFFLGPTSRGLPLFKSRKIYVKSTVAYVLANYKQKKVEQIDNGQAK
jgi:hypothetical protein